mmetsp:Transcript_111890/g.340320  ORF Transcript_111890/g.340320 Transcript_111890/m.340320 type:complete len:304 (-) Transcript_111890:264-1175(-)
MGLCSNHAAVAAGLCCTAVAARRSCGRADASLFRANVVGLQVAKWRAGLDVVLLGVRPGCLRLFRVVPLVEPQPLGIVQQPCRGNKPLTRFELLEGLILLVLAPFCHVGRHLLYKCCRPMHAIKQPLLVVRRPHDVGQPRRQLWKSAWRQLLQGTCQSAWRQLQGTFQCLGPCTWLLVRPAAGCSLFWLGLCCCLCVQLRPCFCGLSTCQLRLDLGSVGLRLRLSCLGLRLHLALAQVLSRDAGDVGLPLGRAWYVDVVGAWLLTLAGDLAVDPRTDVRALERDDLHVLAALVHPRRALPLAP